MFFYLLYKIQRRGGELMNLTNSIDDLIYVTTIILFINFVLKKKTRLSNADRRIVCTFSAIALTTLCYFLEPNNFLDANPLHIVAVGIIAAQPSIEY